MAMNYDKLWKLLIDKKMNRTDLHEQAHVSTNAIATMGKGGDVSTKVLDKICKTLDCRSTTLLITYRIKTTYRKTNCKEHFLCGARTVI